MVVVTDVKQKNKRYLPHELTRKINAVKLYRQTKDIEFVLRRHHISKASLMLWNKLYDGTKESLMPGTRGRFCCPLGLNKIGPFPYNKTG